MTETRPPNATLTGRTILVGVLGWPVSHSLSPLMQNAAIRALGLDAAYVALPAAPERVREAVEGLRALGFRGCNVTIPHKVAVVPHMDRLTPEARIVGAVNTIRINGDGSIEGHNTDCLGAVRALEANGGTVEGRTVVILGAGGAGRGAAVGCALAGAKRIIILNRTAGKAEALAGELASKEGIPPSVAWEAGPLDGERDWSGVDVVMQMTSAGMHGRNDLILDRQFQGMPDGSHALEAVYAPVKTGFLVSAQSKGLRTTDGLSMLVEQGVAAFEFWFGKKPDGALMREVLAASLREA